MIIVDIKDIIWLGILGAALLLILGIAIYSIVSSTVKDRIKRRKYKKAAKDGTSKGNQRRA